MLPAKIKLTDQLINNIKTARIARRIPAATLSGVINRDASYISSLELRRLQTISSVDLIGIIRCLFGISEQRAIEKAIEFIGATPVASNSSDMQHTDALYGGDGAVSVGEPRLDVYRYGSNTGCAEPELINDMLETLAGLIIEFYRQDPKEAVFSLKSFIKTLEFDAMFAMNVMGMPFYMLKTLSIDERREVLSNLLSIITKHTDAAIS